MLRSFLINGLAYFLSAVFETPIKIKKNIEKTGNHFFSDLKEGFGFVIKNNTLKHMLTLFAVLNFFGPPVMIIIPVIIKETGLSGAYLGYYQMTMAIGSFLGALTVLSVTPKKNLISFLTVTLIISGVILIIMGFNQGVVLMLSMQFIMGLVLAWININLMVFFQKLTPDYIKGRFFSILETLAMFIVPFSFLLFGYMVEKYGFEFNLKLCGMAIAVSSVYFYFIPGIHSVLTGSKHEYID